MPKKPFEPNFKTPPDLWNPTERVKSNSYFVNRELYVQFREDFQAHVSVDVETLAKSYGIYLEFDRTKTGGVYDVNWMYMIRISIPGGGPITPAQWAFFDELSEKYTINPHINKPSLRLTTRQNIQFHWVSKKGVLDIVKTLAENDMRSLNGCGDKTRNVMGCPLSAYSDVFDANGWAQKAGAYFQLPLEPYIKVFELDPTRIRKPGESFKYGTNLLNRKFKIAFSALHRRPESGKLIPDNCVEALSNDLAIVPIAEKNKVTAFQVYAGGGQGERNNFSAMSTLAQPLCITTEDNLMQVLDAVVAVHQEWGDRENRQWARLKYVIKKKGVEWYRDQVTSRLGYPIMKPNPDLDIGDRQLHHGWIKLPKTGKWAFGMFVENGRLIDGSPNGNLKTLVREVVKKYQTDLMVTPNQDLLFINIEETAKTDFEADLKEYGYGLRNGKAYSTLRLHSGACVGRDTCRLTYTDSERFEPELLDELEKRGWGHMAESIGITGCERQCFRPATKTIGLIGSGLNRYQFKLMGDEAARHQGVPLIDADGEKMYLRSAPREKVADVIEVLFKFYKANAKAGESMGAYHQRIGMQAIIDHLRENPATAPLMERSMATDCVIE